MYKAGQNIYKRGTEQRITPHTLRQVLTPEAIKELRVLKEKEHSEGGMRLEHIEKEAFDKGFASGEKAGREMGDEMATALLKRVNAIVDEISVFKETFYKEHEDELIALVTAAAKRVVKEELNVNKDVIVNVVTTAIEALTTNDRVVIKLSDADLEYLKVARADVVEALTRVKGYSLETSADVLHGECVIESAHGEVDMRIDEALTRIASSMRSAIRGSEEENET